MCIQHSLGRGFARSTSSVAHDFHKRFHLCGLGPIIKDLSVKLEEEVKPGSNSLSNMFSFPVRTALNSISHGTFLYKTSKCLHKLPSYPQKRVRVTSHIEEHYGRASIIPTGQRIRRPNEDVTSAFHTALSSCPTYLLQIYMPDGSSHLFSSALLCQRSSLQ